VVVYGVPGKPNLGPDVPTPKAEAKSEAQGGGEPVNADAAWRKGCRRKRGRQGRCICRCQSNSKLANGLTVFYNERPGLQSSDRGAGAACGKRRESIIDRPAWRDDRGACCQQGNCDALRTQIADRAADLGPREFACFADSSMIATQSLSRVFLMQWSCWRRGIASKFSEGGN